MKTIEQYPDWDGVHQVIVDWNVNEDGEAFGMDENGRDWFGWVVNGQLINKRPL